MDMQPEKIKVEIKDLSDLTGLKEHAGDRLPSDLIDWLCSTFPNAETQTYAPPPPPGSMGMLLPRTKVVLIVPRFLWGVIQAAVASVAVYELKGDTLDQSLAGVGLGNAIRDMLNAFSALKQQEGEYCTFTALIEADERRIDDVWRVHRQHRETCTVTACRFHAQGCGLTEVGLERILKQMEDRGLVKQVNGRWKRVA